MLTYWVKAKKEERVHKKHKESGKKVLTISGPSVKGKKPLSRTEKTNKKSHQIKNLKKKIAQVQRKASK